MFREQKLIERLSQIELVALRVVVLALLLIVLFKVLRMEWTSLW
jgi:hypothetical protein